jgi:hypothetical protein
MNQTDYIEVSERTEKKFEDGLTLTPENQIILKLLTDDLINIGNGMDHMKKHLIYGAECEIKPSHSEFAPRSLDLDKRKAEFLHHAIGKVTEAVECYQAVIEHVLDGKDLDEVNVLEEIFDGHWYDAGFMRLLGTDFEKGWDTNIAKLFARFPDKFNVVEATVRNLDAERTILESGHSV